MNDKEFEVLKLLFQTHHAQLAEKRAKILAITERTIAALLIIAGWVLTVSTRPTISVRACIVAGVVLIAITATVILLSNNRTYLHVALVIQHLNQMFGVFERGRFIENVTLYPPEWRQFGLARHHRTIWQHYVSIWCVAALVCMTAFVK